MNLEKGIAKKTEETEVVQRSLNTTWKIAEVLSFLLFYTGIVFLYGFIRKTLFRKYHRIILAYHRVHDGKEDPEISVSPAHFKDQITFLQSHFKIVSLNEILFIKTVDILQDTVSITFDDGYKDNFLYAFPILKDKSIPATIFLIVDKINHIEKMLSLEQIHVMQKNGIAFGSHTCTHPILADIPLEEAKMELQLSKKKLESLLQNKVEFFAYPKGKSHHYGPSVKKLVRDHGFKAAITMENGVLTDGMDLFQVKRLGIRDVPMFVFKTRVSGIFESFPFMFARKIFG